MARFRVDPQQKYATGLSGGARGASAFAQYRPGFRGVLLQAAGFATDENHQYVMSGLKTGQRICMIMGLRDPNLRELALVRQKLPASVEFMGLTFDGGHEHAPCALLEQGFDWLMQKAE
jgi:hypothetical protein